MLRTTVNNFVSYTDNDLSQGLHNQGLVHPRLVNLLASSKVYDGDDSQHKLAAFEEYKYDEYSTPLLAYPTDCQANRDLLNYGALVDHTVPFGILGHSPYWNPSPLPTQPNCDGGNGDRYITRRGNMTSIKKYADTSNESTPTGPITETRTYDMTGNVIASSKSCCEQSSSLFNLATQYAFAVSQTRGAADPNSLNRVTTSATYDLATGLNLSSTDANGRVTMRTYLSGSLRPNEIILPTGARTNFEYDNAAMKVTHTTRLSLNGTIGEKSSKTVNGLGQVVQEQSLASSNGGSDVWDYVDTLYDQYGRLWKQSRPYRPGDTKQWKETIYDAAGRVKELREPYTAQEQDFLDDLGTVTKTYYNEPTRPAGASTEPGQTTRTVDPWGRWRWSRLDSRGRLAEVVEPIPAASDPNVFACTKYFYDALDNLIRVEQGDQVRRFRYDSLGRLTAQKLAEASATLTDAGTLVGAGGSGAIWSDIFRYDSIRGNLIQRFDARGVKTNYWYFDRTGHSDPGDPGTAVPDPLNRLQAISYDISGISSGLTVLATPTVAYQYRSKAAVSSLVDITQLTQVVTDGVSTEDFDLEGDAEGRIHEARLTLAGRSKSMTLTYAYDSLGRTTQVTYPEQHHDNVSNPTRKALTFAYDEAGRTTGLKVNNIDYASQLAYNPDSQMTSLAIGTGTNQLTETYQYDAKSGLLTAQSVMRNSVQLKGLAYGYRKDAPCPPGLNCPDVFHRPAYTGQVTTVIDSGKYNYYAYDNVGRLLHTEQWAGASTYALAWTQDYSYDKYGNRKGTTASGNYGGSAVPRDGYQSLSYETSSNRINTTGFTYDPAGYQLTNGTGKSLLYDAAGRLMKVKDQNNTTIESYTYDSSNHRLITQTGDESSTAKTYYVWDGELVVAEYTEPTSATMPQWSRNYIYFGSRLLATEDPNGSSEIVHYHHPNRLGTQVVTNNADSTYFEQNTLPFGVALDAGAPNITNRRFTSYERSTNTGLDYAVNRHYDPVQGRFTQPDPIGHSASSLADPQSLNMYSYVGNDPINRVDPDGQFWGALFNLIGGLFSSLKPNIVSGSFTYHNHPPVSVSFTTDFRNVGVGFGGFGLSLRTGGLWLPAAVGAMLPGDGLHLSSCLQNLLRPFFPAVDVFGTAYSAVDQAQFFPGIPTFASYYKKPEAITLGFDIHYDDETFHLDMNGGSGDYLATIIEEVAHVDQFIKMWSYSPKIVSYKLTGFRLPRLKRVETPLNYVQARQRWKLHYVDQAVWGYWNKGDSYDNLIEFDAKRKMYNIYNSLRANAIRQKKDDICGFGLYYDVGSTRYRAIY